MLHIPNKKMNDFPAAATGGWQQYNWRPRPLATSRWFTVQRILAGVALGVMIPFFALLYVAVRLTSKGPFIYRQQRPGLGGRIFTAYKIRTMKLGADKDLRRARQVNKSDPMITSIGGLLRDLKLDELPQLFNVVKGEMALVGPRPIAPELQKELAQKIPGFSRRLHVRPGLTSLAQVCIFDNADAVVDDWSVRFEGELQYLYHRSWRYDLVIIWLTLLFLFKKLYRRVPKIVRMAPLLMLFFLVACSDSLSTQSFMEAEGVYAKNIQGYGVRSTVAVPIIEPISVDGEEAEPQEAEYKVGSGDKLAINIFGEEGLDKLVVGVDGAGFIQVPFMERIQVAGQSVAEIQTTLKQGFSAQFLNPWVVVQIVAYKSRPVYLLGEFNSPGVIYLNGPTNLLQAMSMGQGLSGLAHLRGARLWRGDEIAAVDIQALLVEGKPDYNIFLQAGDTLFVPSKTDKKAFILGAVTRPGAVAFSNEPMTLLKALAQVGGPIRASALLSQVRVIRTHSALEGQLILINANDILNGYAPDLELMPDDIVFVPQNWIENWSQVVKAVAPTLQLMGGVLQPFVQIKFLKGN